MSYTISAVLVFAVFGALSPRILEWLFKKVDSSDGTSHLTDSASEETNGTPKLIEDERNRTIIDTTARDLISPSDIRGKLEEIGNENPDLRLLVTRCIRQLDSIREDREHFEIVVAPSGMEALLVEDMRKTLIDIEQAVLQNMKDIMNFCIIAGSREGKATWDKLDQKGINEELESNDIKIAKNKEFLIYLVNAINQHDNEFSNVEIDSWITAVKQQVSIEKCKGLEE